jgi:purine-binding chemotaxis protein CheW
MRPLPVETVPGVPSFVRGTTIVRGKPTPVIDLRDLLGDDVDRSPARLVTVRLGPERRVGLLVDEVLGLRDGSTLSVDSLPPLLADAAAGVVDELARLDGELLTILRAGSLLPEDVWARMSGAE